MKKGLSRRDVVLGGAVVLCGGCATTPGRSDRLPSGSTEQATDRACDHDLCRYWRLDPVVPSGAPALGEPRIGRCSVGLPEDL